MSKKSYKLSVQSSRNIKSLAYQKSGSSIPLKEIYATNIFFESHFLMSSSHCWKHKSPKNRPKLDVTHAAISGGNKTRKTKGQRRGTEVTVKLRLDSVERDVKMVFCNGD